MKFIIDSNILITAWRDTYPRETFGSFWTSLKERIELGEIVVCESVFNEIKKGNDDLWVWLSSFVSESHIVVEKPSADNIIASYRVVIAQANSNPNYKSSAISAFADNADGWIIAHALANNYIVVTEEKSSFESKKSVKIPDICSSLGVQFTNTVGMLKLLKVSF